MHTIAFASIALSCLFSFGAHAYMVNGNMLLNDFEKRKPAAAGYIEGVTDMGNRSHFCVPGGTVTSQLKKTAFDYLNENREILDKPAALIVTQAFKETYPCDEPDALNG